MIRQIPDAALYLGESIIFADRRVEKVDNNAGWHMCKARHEARVQAVSKTLKTQIGRAQFHPLNLPHRPASSRLRFQLSAALIIVATTAFFTAALAETGMASWYGAQHQGRRTASGERFNQHAMTAAHRSLPFNTMVKVCRLPHGKCVVVRINDFGPAARTGRIIDLSRRAAEELGIIHRGIVRVRVERLR